MIFFLKEKVEICKMQRHKFESNSKCSCLTQRWRQNRISPALSFGKTRVRSKVK